MERVPQLVRRGKKDRRMGAPSELDWEAIEALRTEMRVELIQELIPLGLAEVGRVEQPPPPVVLKGRQAQLFAIDRPDPAGVPTEPRMISDIIATVVVAAAYRGASTIPSDPTAPAAAFPRPLRRLSRRPGS